MSRLQRLCAALVLAGLVTGSLYAPLPPAHAQQASPQQAAPLRIVILPFKNISRQSSDDWLADSFAESLTMGLLRVDALRVVERVQLQQIIKEQQFAQSVWADEAAAPRLGRMLGANVVVLGSFQRAGDQLQANVRFVDVETGQIDTRRFAQAQGAFQELFALQERLATGLIAQLEVQAQPAELAELAKTVNATRSPEAQRHYLEGLEHLRIGEMLRLKEAVKAFRKALVEDEAYAMAYAGLAEAYARLAQGEKLLLVQVPVDGFMRQSDPLELARQYAEQARSLSPDLPQTLRAQAWIENAAGNTERALVLAREAIRRAPRDSDSVTLYMSLRFERGFTSLSVAQLRQELTALGADLNDPWTQFTLAAFAFGLEATKPDAQLGWIAELLKDAAAKLPRMAYIPLVQYGLKMYQGEAEQAQRFFNQAYVLGQDSPDILTALAILRLSEQRPEEALKLVEQAEKIYPEGMMVRMTRADVLAAMGDQQAAQAIYSAMAREHPDNAMIPFSQGSRLIGEDPLKARDLMATALRNWEKEPAGLPRALIVYLLGVAEMMSQNWDAARQHFETLRSDANYYGQAYQQLAHIYHIQQDPAAALEAYQAFLSIYPDRARDESIQQQYRLYYLLARREQEPGNASVLNDLGQLSQLRGDLSEAEQYWTLALKLNPQEAVIYYNLGSLQLQLQQWAEASQHLQQAVRLRPDYVRAWFNLGLAYQGLGQSAQAREAWQRVLILEPAHAQAREALQTEDP